MIYGEFVRGVLSSGTLNIEEVEEWKKERSRSGITEQEHLRILKKFGFKSDDDLDRIKTYISTDIDCEGDGHGDAESLKLKESKTRSVTTCTGGRGGDCIICWEYKTIDENGIGHMITPCNHVVLCGGCADTHYAAPHHGQTCPNCRCDVVDVKTVYFS